MARAAEAEAVVDGAQTLTRRHSVIKALGTFPDNPPEDGRESPLAADATARLLDDLRRRVREAPREGLVDEPGLWILLKRLLDEDSDAGRVEVAAKLDDDEFFLAVLASAYSVGRAGNDSRQWEVPRLDWATLVHIMGPEVLSQRVGALASSDIDSRPPDRKRALALAVRYATGHAPPL
jgi:hypothetical protein